MSASEQIDYELEELVSQELGEQPKRYEEIIEGIRARGGIFSSSEVTDILENEYITVIWRDEEGDMEVGYRKSDAT